MLTFTGSTEVGRHFMRYSADSNLKRVYLELGGKSEHHPADALTWMRLRTRRPGRSSSTPARCVPQAPGWWFMPMWPTGGGADRRDLRAVVSGRSAQTQMGPLVDERSLQRVLGHLDRGLAEGASLRVGGHRVLAETGGAYLEPTVVTGAAPDNPIVREEIFGPCLPYRWYATKPRPYE